MKFTVQEIAKSIGAQVFGDPQIQVSSVAEPKLASELDIALAINPKYFHDLKDTSAKCALPSVSRAHLAEVSFKS